MGHPLAPMIPASRRAPRMPLRALTVAVLAAACGCAHRPSRDASTPVREGLSGLGRISGESADPRVVIVKDRHATHGAITRSRDRLRGVRRENRDAVAFLLLKGYDLLGCEAALGPLPEGGAADAHRAAVTEALAEGDDLDALTVYQPIRLQEEFRGRLTVLGVEDPGLYSEDARRLEEVIRLRGLRARNDVPESERAAALAAERALVAEVTAQARERGRRAALNLLDHMRKLGRARAILMVGGAHSGAADEALRAAGVSTLGFECGSYARPDGSASAGSGTGPAR